MESGSKPFNRIIHRPHHSGSRQVRNQVCNVELRDAGLVRVSHRQPIVPRAALARLTVSREPKTSNSQIPQRVESNHCETYREKILAYAHRSARIPRDCAWQVPEPSACGQVVQMLVPSILVRQKALAVSKVVVAQHSETQHVIVGRQEVAPAPLAL